MRLPQGTGVRNDVGVENGSVVPIDYDPMLGKLIIHATDRSKAIARLTRALAEYEIAGVETTLLLFRALTKDPEFRRAAFDVQWLDRRLSEGLLSELEPTEEDVLLGAIELADSSSEALSVGEDREASLWRRMARREGLRTGTS